MHGSTSLRNIGGKLQCSLEELARASEGYLKELKIVARRKDPWHASFLHSLVIQDTTLSPR